MTRRPEYYTDHPRTILWLVPGEGNGEGEGDVEPFYLGKLPVTNQQFEAFDPGFERHPASPGDRDPATGVSWHDADEYCRWYAEVSRKPMRLPTECEWEHACRGGAAGTWSWGDDPAAGDEHAWDAESSGGRMRPLDAKKANGFGLFAMLGGVWEWTGTLFRPVGGPAPGEEPPRYVLRGGSFLTPRAEATCARRRAEPAGARFPDAGFRVARSLRV